MTTKRAPRPSPALGLGLGLILAIAPPSSAQQPASGSGAGTGTGLEAGGAGSTGTGMEAGGLGATSGRPFMRPAGGPSIYGPAGPTGPRFDPLESPRVVVPGEVERLIGRGTEELMRDALAVVDPGERSLALVRVARTSIFLGRPDFGHQAVFHAADDAQLVTDDTLHDQRIVNVIEAALALAEEHMRDIRVFESAPRESPGLPAPLQPKNDRAANLELGRQEWDLAFRLVFTIRNPSARPEMGYHVVESESIGSASLVREPFRLLGTRPDPRRLPAPIRNFADSLIVTAIEHATKVDRPVWRDRALTAIATNAAVSGQFERAEQAARTIPQPEVRTDAYLKIAENDIIFGRPADATRNYQAAATSIAEVPLADPRETLVGVLIDSLIAFGRFDDARASTVLYANPSNPPIALAAVAESQGRRGLAKSAQEWIARETSPELRSLLYRKLNDGLLAAFEQKRSAELSRGAP